MLILALALAYLTAGNLLAAALATTLANPITIPLIALATFRLGEVMLAIRSAEAITAAELFHKLEHLELSELWQPVLKPMLLGASLLGALVALIAYGVTRFAVRSFKARRHARLLERAGLAATRTQPIFSPGDTAL